MVNFFDKLEISKIWLIVLTGSLVAVGISLGAFITIKPELVANIATGIAPHIYRLGLFANGRYVEEPARPSMFRPLLKPMIFEPRFVTIEKIGVVKADVVEVGVEEDGRLGVPRNPMEIGWYKDGPRAGEEGNAIIAGHYDTNTGKPAVFYKLTDLMPGDRIGIEDATAKIYTFEVTTIEYVSINDPESVTKAYEETNDPILTVITCGGVWNPIKHDYNDRLLIKAKRV